MAVTRVASFNQDVCIAEEGTVPQKLFGVQGFEGNWELPLTPVKAAGYGMINHDPQGALQGDVSISRLMTQSSSADPLINYSAGGGLLAVPISGFLIYGPSGLNQGFSFTNSRVTSYSSSCEVGGIASSDFSLSVYGNMVSGSGTPTFPARGVLGVAIGSDIEVEVLGSGTNAVQGYNFRIDLDWEPLYGIGGLGQPVGYRLNYPLEVKVDFDMIVDTYAVENLSGLVCARSPESLNIIVRTGCERAVGTLITVPNAELQSTSFSSTVNDNLMASFSYVAYIEESGDISNLFPTV